MDHGIPTPDTTIETDDQGNLKNSIPYEFQTLYKYINKIYLDLKTEVTNITVEVKRLIELNENNTKEDDDTVVSSSLTALNGRCLILEESVRNITEQHIPHLKEQKNKFVKQDTLSKIIGNVEKREKENNEEVKRILRENLSNANNQHKKFLDFKNDYEKNDLRNHDVVNGRCSNNLNVEWFVKRDEFVQMKQDLTQRIEKNHNEILNAISENKQSDEINANRFKFVPEIPKDFEGGREVHSFSSVNTQKNIRSNLQSLAEYDNGVIQQDTHLNIDCDALFLTDSNLYKMDCSIMNYGSVCQQVKCPLIKDVLSVIQDGTFEKQVSWVYIQCGTNDLEHEEVDSVTYKLSDVIDKVKQKFDNAKIVISSLLPRRDLQNEVARVNEYLYTLVT